MLIEQKKVDCRVAAPNLSKKKILSIEEESLS
jgi:hypothetical protein